MLMKAATETAHRMDAYLRRNRTIAEPVIEFEGETAYVFVEKKPQKGVGAVLTGTSRAQYEIHVEIFGTREGQLPVLVTARMRGDEVEIYDALGYDFQVLRARTRGYTKYDPLRIGSLGIAEDAEMEAAAKARTDDDFRARRKALFDG